MTYYKSILRKQKKNMRFGTLTIKKCYDWTEDNLDLQEICSKSLVKAVELYHMQRKDWKLCNNSQQLLADPRCDIFLLSLLWTLNILYYFNCEYFSTFNIIFVMAKYLFKLNNKITRTTSILSVWCLYCELWRLLKLLWLRTCFCLLEY